MGNRKSLKSWALTGCAAFIMAQGAAYAAEPSKDITADTRVTFDIASQNLGAALNEFGLQSGLEISFVEADIKGRTVQGLAGAYDPVTALERLLENTGIDYRVNELGTILVGAATRQAGYRAISLTSDAEYQARLGGYAEDEDKDKIEELELEEIVVTGSHIRGVGVSVGSKVEIIDRAEIDRSGFATTHQVIQSLPQNFQGGVNEDTFGVGATSSVSQASSVNLRGLGADATLTLLNGRRIPIAGRFADFVDVSNIPATAIERIEVLNDGASAIYGSDAIGGVVNIILRDDFEGAETRARFGTVTEGGLQEYQFGQLFGTNWDSGNAMISYEYYKRDPLDSSARKFSATQDLRSLGGEDFRSTNSNPGNILGPTFQPAFAIPSGQDGTSLDVSDLLPGVVNLQNLREGTTVQGGQERHSVFATFSQKLSESIELFAEGSYNKRDFLRRISSDGSTLRVPSSNPFFVDPFGGSSFVRVNYSFLDDLGNQIQTGDTENYNIVLGGTADIDDDWQIKFFGSYSKEDTTNTTIGGVDTTALNAALADPDPATAFNPFGDGSNTNPATLEKIRGDQRFGTNAELWSGNVTVDGTLFHLPGGGIKLAVGTDYREETWGRFSDANTGPALVPFTREVVAFFGELFIPLFDEANRRSGLERLIVSAAVRYEDYSGFGNIGGTTNPKFGLLWSPVEDLRLRASYGTSFKAPNLPDLDESRTGRSGFPISDPLSPTGSTLSIFQFGGNANLQNETATTWTAGLNFTPSAVPGLEFDMTYFNIDFKDKVGSIPNFATALINEAQFASLIIRNPTQAQIDTVCNMEVAGDFLNPDICAGLIPVGAIIDLRLNNIARTKVEGLDFTINYGFETKEIGRFDFRVNGNYLFTFEEADTPTSPVLDLVSTVGNPIDFRMRNSVTWSNDNGLSATAYINYADSYKDTQSAPERKVDSWTTVDLTLSYSTGDLLNNIGLSDTTFTLSVLNLFDTDPPFVNNPVGVGYDPANADPLARFISFNIKKKF